MTDHIPAGDRFTEARKKVTTGAFSLTSGEGNVFRIVSVRFKFNTAPSTSEDLIVAVDSVADDATFDTVLFTKDPSTASNTDVVWVPADDQARDIFTQGNHIKASYANTDNRTLTAVITLERIA